MADSPTGAPPAGTAPEDRLDSWKEIAAYLKRDVTTVQRWEKREQMPVRRHLHDKLGSVYAFRSELDAWARNRNLTVGQPSEQAAAISRDGRFVAFLSDRDGRTDVWVTQVGAGQFYNLTRGRVRELVNPSVRMLGFSPDGALVTFWARGVEGSAVRDIAVWAVPTP